MRRQIDPCSLTGSAPHTYRGRYHRGHSKCIKAAKREEAEIRYEPIAAAKAEAAKASAAAAAKAAALAQSRATKAAPDKKSPRKRTRRPERKKASQR